MRKAGNLIYRIIFKNSILPYMYYALQIQFKITYRLHLNKLKLDNFNTIFSLIEEELVLDKL